MSKTDREICEAATPNLNGTNREQWDKDTQFIAHYNPEKISSMLDRIEELETRDKLVMNAMERARIAYCKKHGDYEWPDLAYNIVWLVERFEEMGKERDDARIENNAQHERIVQLENELAEYQDKPEAFERLRELLRTERRMRKIDEKRLTAVAEQRDEARRVLRTVVDGGFIAPSLWPELIELIRDAPEAIESGGPDPKPLF